MREPLPGVVLSAGHSRQIVSCPWVRNEPTEQATQEPSPEGDNSVPDGQSSKKQINNIFNENNIDTCSN